MALIDDLQMWCDLIADASDQHGARSPTLVGTPTFPADYLKLDGGTDYVHYPSDAGIAVASGDFSVALWGYLDSVAGNFDFASKWGAASPGQEWQVQWSNGLGNMRLIARDSSGGTGAVDATTFGALSANTFYFIACGWRQATNVLWISVNGGAIDTQPGAALGVGGGTFRLELGESSQGLASPMNGRLKSFGYWQRDIGTDRVALYNGGTALTYADITGGGPFDPSGNAGWQPEFPDRVPRKGGMIASGTTRVNRISSLAAYQDYQRRLRDGRLTPRELERLRRAA